MIKEPEEKQKETLKKSKRNNGSYSLIIDENLSSSFSESFKTLRTNIHYSFNEKPGKLLLITSSFPQEGKTTMAINLALTMAQAGQKVLLLDTDLRMPSLYKVFGHDRNQGLTKLLIDVYTPNLTEGDLSQYGIGDLFHILNMQGKSGLLTISENGQIYHLRFHDGYLKDAQWKNRPEEERIGNLLIESGKITPDQQMKALKRQVYAQEKLGTILMNMNLISPQDLEGPLKLHLAGLLRQIYSLRQGKFSFKEERFLEGYSSISGNGWGNNEFFQNIQKLKLKTENIPFIDQKISSYLQDCPVNNLKILNSGPIPSNPTELLGSRRIQELIGILKERFDTIIFDSPPVNAVSDACILSSQVDGVILVVHVGQSNRKGVQKCKQQLEAVKANIYGVILNRLDMKKNGYYSYGYYRHHYGYYHQQKPDQSAELN